MRLNSNYIKATLPIKKDGKLILDLKSAEEFGSSLNKEYSTAVPYPHIVIDDFLPIWLIEEILNLFPYENTKNDNFFETTFSGLHKRQVLPFNCNERIQTIFNFFNSIAVIKFLEKLTNINALIGDPYFGGGGFHEIKRGGHLGVHADFRIQTDLHLQRRINILIYLNKNWKSEYGSNLEIWNDKVGEKFKSIEPIFNRCVIFNTDANSYHGHPDPLDCPQELTRKSIALYYYTASKLIYEEIPSYSTMYAARPHDNNHIKLQAFKLRMHNYLNDWLPPIGYRAFKNTMKFTRKLITLNKFKI